jgi:gluconolactonase
MRVTVRRAVLAAGAVAALVLVVGARSLNRLGRHLWEPRTLGRVVRIDARFDRIIAPGTTTLEVIAEGFGWAEGPVWVPRDGGFLLFSDLPRNAIMKWSPPAGVTLFMKPSGYTGVARYGRDFGSNGLTLDREGRLLIAEHGDRRIERLDWNGGKRTLADNYQGKRLNSPNDLVVRSNGDVYFTDPIYGLPRLEKDARRELDFCGVYRWSRNTGEVTLLTRELSRPNGLAFSPDERTLYIANSDVEKSVWMAYPVLPDGVLGVGKVIRDVTELVANGTPGGVDGLKVDQSGTIFAAGPGGVHVFLPDGTLLGLLDTERATNLAWGDDGSVLYVTTDHYLLRVKTLTRGVSVAKSTL